MIKILTPIQMDNLEAFQNADCLHPMTCCGETMGVSSLGLVCGKCNRIQTDIMPSIIDGTLLETQRAIMTGLGSCRFSVQQ
jgi:hypothetical protein